MQCNTTGPPPPRFVKPAGAASTHAGTGGAHERRRERRDSTATPPCRFQVRPGAPPPSYLKQVTRVEFKKTPTRSLQLLRKESEEMRRRTVRKVPVGNLNLQAKNRRTDPAGQTRRKTPGFRMARCGAGAAFQSSPRLTFGARSSALTGCCANINIKVFTDCHGMNFQP